MKEKYFKWILKSSDNPQHRQPNSSEEKKIIVMKTGETDIFVLNQENYSYVVVALAT